MEFRTSCPHCQQGFEATEEHVGVEMNCPTCSTSFVIQREEPQSSFLMPTASMPSQPEVELDGQLNVVSKKISGVLFYVFFTLYTIVPIIGIPIWAYYQKNWWLLFGIASSFLGAVFSRAIGIILVGCAGFWIIKGFSIYHYTTFFSLCFLWGCITSEVAEEYKKRAERVTA